MNNEYDTREWARTRYVRPALAALHAVTNSADALRTDGIDLDSQRYLYSSFGCSNTEDTIAGIIDSLRVNGLWKRGRPDMPMTVEHRSPGAINDNTNEQRRQTWLPKHSLIPFY